MTLKSKITAPITALELIKLKDHVDAVRLAEAKRRVLKAGFIELPDGTFTYPAGVDSTR